jgi:threonine dehydrogenase-like Zn-dependent dehydrogenase
MMDLRECFMPVTLGHEYVGVVTETCGVVGNFRIGDWVVTLPACYSCGECNFCRRGEVTLCKQRRSIGSHRNGAMAEYLIVPAKYSFKIPENIEDRLACAAIEPLACAGRGICERIDVKPGDVAVLSGPGNIGLAAIEFLKLRGAYVIASGLPSDGHRLKVARQLGADVAVDNVSDLKAAVEAKNSWGADIAVEASGADASLNICLDIVKTHGTLLELGVFTHVVTCKFGRIFEKELFVTASNSTAMSTWELTLRLLGEGKLDLPGLVSLRVPLEEWERGFEAARNREALKILLIP